MPKLGLFGRMFAVMNPGRDDTDVLSNSDRNEERDSRLTHSERDRILNPDTNEDNRGRFCVKTPCFQGLMIWVFILSLSATGISIYNIVAREKMAKTHENPKEFRKEMRGEMNDMDKRIDAFMKEFNSFTTTLTDELNDLKTSADETMNTFTKDLINAQSGISGLKSDVQELRENVVSVESSMQREKAKVWREFTGLTNKFDDLETCVDEKMNKFSKNLTNVENDISEVNSEVQNLTENVTNVEDSMGQEKTKVWGEFRRLKKEIDNLPKNRGNSRLVMNMSLPIFIIIVTMAFSA